MGKRKMILVEVDYAKFVVPLHQANAPLLGALSHATIVDVQKTADGDYVFVEEANKHIRVTMGEDVYDTLPPPKEKDEEKFLDEI